MAARGARDDEGAHIVFNNNNRGYVRCTLTPNAWTSEFRKVSTVEQEEGVTASTLATLVVENGLPGARLAV